MCELSSINRGRIALGHRVCVHCIHTFYDCILNQDATGPWVQSPYIVWAFCSFLLFAFDHQVDESDLTYANIQFCEVSCLGMCCHLAVFIIVSKHTPTSMHTRILSGKQALDTLSL